MDKLNNSSKNLVKQSTCLAPTLYGISTGQYCTEKYRTISGIYVGSVKINLLAFVDDKTDPNRSKLDSIRPNENAVFFEKVKRLTFSVDKCKSLNINAREEEEIPTLEINGSTVENAKEFNYLGDYLIKKGNNDGMIDDRIKKGEGKVYVIQAF